ncbi:hypothetical protein BN7_4577 [Wickerhamomyces ciferrii]|uniref:Uncharacterized protein n=1 Tax=Wickerhamomyces ciferrii (strain ATCC 14091 / BCRC 22168 / CBS 111 / JCM 3599 / NBRC 0793 / NRRL Y-1031 F-60-10) TaxID=1206466 RepID=K0KV09_WICCF|nr:uncharacterized protein BN7_4577 [Wickerhamomyces ciferrii]CCH44998.1 hypothetical protein BN7_4577 [Wickerhamomyces ciferrii]
MSEFAESIANSIPQGSFIPQDGIDAPYTLQERNPILDEILNEDEEEQDGEDSGDDYDDEYAYEYDSDDSLDDELKLINAQLQWEESLDQLKTLAGWVILPLIGKMLGRRFAGISEYKNRREN